VTVRSARTAAASAVVLVLTMTGSAAPAGAAADSPDDLPAPTAAQLTAAVQAWDPAGSVKQWDVGGSVRSLETVETEGTETTISLATDILFSSQSYALPASAAPRIAELLAAVPDGAAVQVHGHTDSLVGPIPNDELSRNRAQAVADVIAVERPDLALEVAGFADTEPAEREDPDDPSTYAANRRVEIVYGG
jgi:OOP family OmpA-OmpF porin